MSESIPSWAVPGAKVVCVGRERRPWEPLIINDRGIRWLPSRGAIYTIRKTEYDWLYGWFIYLTEQPKPQCFPVDAFRPLVTRSQEQDIATHFRDLLRQPEPVA